MFIFIQIFLLIYKIDIFGMKKKVKYTQKQKVYLNNYSITIYVIKLSSIFYEL